MTSLVGVCVTEKDYSLCDMGIESRGDVSRTLSPQVVDYEDTSWRGIACMNCSLTADDVLVPMLTGQIVSQTSCHGPVLEISSRSKASGAVQKTRVATEFFRLQRKSGILSGVVMDVSS